VSKRKKTTGTAPLPGVDLLADVGAPTETPGRTPAEGPGTTRENDEPVAITSSPAPRSASASSDDDHVRTIAAATADGPGASDATDPEAVSSGDGDRERPEPSASTVEMEEFAAELAASLTDSDDGGHAGVAGIFSRASGERHLHNTHNGSGSDSASDPQALLRGTLEAVIFASDSPIGLKDLARLAASTTRAVKEALAHLQHDYRNRGIQLDEVAGGWVFRTSPRYANAVRDLTKQKPVRLSRAQVETMAIIAYRQPITRPEIDEVRGVDSGPVLKVLLERDLVRILGKRDEPGRPLIYGTTPQFLEFFGLRSLKDLPTLREFTELSDESREAFEDELQDDASNGASDATASAPESPSVHDSGGTEAASAASSESV